MQPATYSAGRAPRADDPRRKHPRVLFSVPVTIRHLMPGGVRSSRGISLDLSENGMGALVEGGLQTGDKITIEFSLSGRQLQAVAIVRHSSVLRSGFEFLGLNPKERGLIASAVQTN
jgi:c-di-GMP-binding flagellar brake protein YcgR